MNNRYLLLLLSLLFSLNGYSQTINTFAGNGVSGYSGDGGLATAAALNRPIACTMDNAGNLLISDFYNSCIRKVSSSGIITTIAGTGTAGYSGDGGPATAAQINCPEKITVDPAGNIYFCDFYNQRIRKINTSGIISTIAGTGTVGYTGDGGPATAATFWNPGGITIDATGNIFIADEWNNRIRKIDVSGIITTVAGSGPTGFLVGGYGGDGGPASAAEINFPVGIDVNAAGDVFFSDDGNSRVRKISATGIITTVAGNGISGSTGDGGVATSAEINNPEGIALDLSGNLYICEAGGNRVRKVNTAGIISTIAGTGVAGFSGDGGPAVDAQLNVPEGVFADSNSSCIYICDAGNNRVRRVGTCDAAVVIASCDSIKIPDSLFICPGGRDTLLSTLYGTSTPLIIQWSPSSGLSATNILDPVFTAGASGWRYLTVESAIGANLVTNGDFSAGNTGFTSGYSYVTSGPGALTPPGLYTITMDPSLDNPGAASIGDHTTGTGNMMAINGASTPVDVWCETITVVPHTNYIFSVWAANWSSDTANNLPILQFQINGSLVGDSFNFPHPDGVWRQFYTTWNSGTNTTASICIYDEQTAFTGNDFALDDISFQQFCTATDSMYITVTNADIGNYRTDSTACVSEPRVLLTAPSGYDGYSWNTGATTDTLSATVAGTYWVVCENGGCTAQTDTFGVTIDPLPAINLGNDTSICKGDSIVLSSPISTGSFKWSNGDTTHIAKVPPGVFTLTVTLNGCSNADTVSIGQVPNVPLVNLGFDTILCIGNSIVLATGTDTAVWSTGVRATQITVMDSGIYWASLSNQCSTSIDTINIGFELCNFTFPSAFTPNGDGLNDIARALGSLNIFSNYSLSIYNRWGERVFYTEDIYQGWNGTYKGLKADVGAYFYMIYYSLEGKQHMLKGDLTLIR